MTNRWITVMLAAAAIALAGCNKQESSTTEVDTETQATGEGAIDAAPDGTEGTPEAPPAEMVPPVDAAGTPADPAASPADNGAAAAAGGEVTLPGGTKYVDEVV